MITVKYGYERKSDGRKAIGRAEFQDARKAARFARSMRGKGNPVFGWSCDDPEEMEEMGRLTI